MTDVEFYFYLGCPWTYLAFTRLRESAMRAAGRIVWKPILVERIQQKFLSSGIPAHGPPDTAREAYRTKDLQDWARFCGLTIRHPGFPPVPAAWAMRGSVAAMEAAAIVPYCETVFRRCFEDGAEINNMEAVVALAAEAGLDPDRFRVACGDAESLAAVERNSDELVARGGFGSPTMFIGDDMYFGNDRMPLVELALGQAAERPLIVPGAHGQF